jgi:serine/threonine protein kinase
VPSDPLIGQILHGKYRVIRALGEGGMGAVYEAVQLDLDRRVAIKVPRAELAQDAKIVERFRREAIAAAKLMHPNIPQILEFIPGPPLVIAMELLSGMSLADLLARGRVPVARACAIAAQIASALETAHAVGIVHRDLKPGNVFLVPVANGDLAMLLDFGVAKLTESATYSRLTDSGVLVGTPRYASPEQIVARPDVDGRADVYSLGVLLYGMLSGRAPFTTSGAQLLIEIQSKEPPDLAVLAPDVPAELVLIVHRALKKSPADRFANMREMGAALAPFVPRVSDAPPSFSTGSLELSLPSGVDTERDAATGELAVVSLELPREDPSTVPDKHLAKRAPLAPEREAEPPPPEPKEEPARSEPKRSRTGCVVGAAVAALLGCAAVSCPGYLAFQWLLEEEEVMLSSSSTPLTLALERARAVRDTEGHWAVTAQLTITNPADNPTTAIESDDIAVEGDLEPVWEGWTFPDQAQLVPGQSVFGTVAFYADGTSARPTELVIWVGEDSVTAPIAAE